MGYVGKSFEIPAGQGALNSDLSPLTVPATDLITAEGITQEGESNRKEGGARLIDANGFAGAVSIADLFSHAVKWDAVISTWKPSGTPTHVQSFSHTLAPAVREVTTTGPGLVSSAFVYFVGGVGTHFLSDIHVGDTITVGSQTVAVAAVMSDTFLRVASAISPDWVSQPYKIAAYGARITVPSDTTAGNTLFLTTVVDRTPSPFIAAQATITDTAGNTYRLLRVNNVTDGVGIAVYYCENANALLTNRPFTGTGVVKTGTTPKDIFGSFTHFLTDKPKTITILGQTRTVDHITDDTHLSVTADFSPTFATNQFWTFSRNDVIDVIPVGGVFLSSRRIFLVTEYSGLATEAALDLSGVGSGNAASLTVNGGRITTFPELVFGAGGALGPANLTSSGDDTIPSGANATFGVEGFYELVIAAIGAEATAPSDALVNDTTSPAFDLDDKIQGVGDGTGGISGNLTALSLYHRIDGPAISAPIFTGDFDAATRQWVATIAAYRSETPIIATGQTASAAVTSGLPSSLELEVPAGGFTNGNTVFIAVALGPSRTITSVTDDSGMPNTWDTSATVHSSSGNIMRTGFIVNHNANGLTAGKKITVNFSGPTIACLVATEFTGLSPTTPLNRFNAAVGSVVGDLSHATVQLSAAPVELRVWNQFRVIEEGDAESIIALADWHPSSGVQRILTATTKGNLYRSNLAMTNLDEDLLNNAVSDTKRGFFIYAGKEQASDNRRVFYLDGVSLPVCLTGDDNHADALDPDTQAPEDWRNTGNRPGGGIIFADRFFAYGNANFPHAMYVSSITDHRDFRNAFDTGRSITITTSTGVGDRLIGAAGFKSTLYFFKYPRGIGFLDTTDSDIRNWTGMVISESLGVVNSPYAVLPTDKDCLFLCPDGSVHRLSAIDTPNGVQTSDVSMGIHVRNWVRDHVNMARLDQVVSAYYPLKKWALFALPSKGSTVNDLILKFDLANMTVEQADYTVERSANRVKFSVSRRDMADAMAVWRDAQAVERVIIGEGGFAYEIDRPERLKAGQEYRMETRTPAFDYGQIASPDTGQPDAGLRAKRKIFDNVELIQRPTAGVHDITLEHYIDDRLAQTLVFKTHLARQRKRLVGDGRTSSWRVYNTEGDPDVLSILVGLRVGDEDTNRGTSLTPTLTLTLSGNGTGSATTDTGLNVSGPGGSATQSVAYNTVATITATPEDDSEFVGWSGDASGTANPLTFDVVKDSTVIALFRLKPLLTITEDGDGTGTVTSDVGGIDCGETCISTPLATGAAVVLTATPADDSEFIEWSGDATGSDNPLNVSLDANKTINATFNLKPRLLVTIEGTGSGTVTSDV